MGANIGQSAAEFRKKLPQTPIHCFEPSASTFQQLQQNLSGYNNIYFHNLALGGETKVMKMVHGESSDKNRLVRTDEIATAEADSEEVQMTTLTEFCRQHNIQNISYLKIDTEGFDLEVLKSGDEMLRANAFDFVEVEVGMNPTNKLHVPVEEVKKYMEERKYYVFGIYEQVHDWVTQRQFLRRTNTVFVSGKVAGF